jgi:hypothetical protein
MDKKTNRVSYFVENNLNPITGWYDSQKKEDYQLNTTRNNKEKRRAKLFARVKRQTNDNDNE